MILLWLAFIIDFFLADPQWFPHPVRFMGNYISFFEKNVRKIAKSKTALKLAGFFLAVSLVCVSFIIPWFVLKFAYTSHTFLGLVLELLFIWTCIALRCLDKEVMKIYQSLKEGNLEQAKKQISYIVSRDTQSMDESQIIKATIETTAENTSDGIIAPLFFLFLGGVPLAFAYKAINTMDSMVGYKNEKYIDFGWFSAHLDDIANWIPARLTGFFMILWAFFTKKDWKNGLFILFRDHKKSKSPNAGWPEAATAGILNIELCGSSYYFGKLVKKETIGDNKKNLHYEDIKNTKNLMYGSVFLMLLCGTIIKIIFRWW